MNNKSLEKEITFLIGQHTSTNNDVEIYIYDSQTHKRQETCKEDAKKCYSGSPQPQMP